MNITDRIYQFIEHKGISTNEFSKKVGVSNGYFAKQRASKANVGSTIIEKIVSAYCEINLNWLILGVGEMIVEKNKENVSPIIARKQSAQNGALSAHYVSPLAEFDPHVSVVQAKTMTEAEQGIPLIPLEATAGPFLGNSTQIFDYDCERYVVPEFSKADFLIRVTGDSMEPYYIAGDMVACKKLNLDTFFQWNEVYLIDSEQGVLIKRVKPGSTPATLSLVSDNKAYDPVELERAEVYGLARVLGLLRFN